jgi:hypothetical protein
MMAASVGKKGCKIDFSSAIKTGLGDVTPDPVIQEPPKKPGRPKGGKVKKIYLSIQEDLYEGMRPGVALLFNGNRTAYINALIRKDLDENADKYREFSNLMK